MATLVGLSSTPAAAAWTSEAIAGTTVELYTPAGVSSVGDGRALMVVLHGCTQEAAALREHGNLAATADALGVVMAVPAVPGGGVVAGCWDYYGSNHSRTSGHNGPMLEMVDTLLGDGALSIDADQVYVVGLSSGGGQALVLGCLAPDVFAGIGAVASPALGTGVADGGVVATNAAAATELCESLAGVHAPDLASQVAFSFYDAADFVVADGYNQINTEVFAAVLSDGLEGMTAKAVAFESLPGTMPTGSATYYADAGGVRVARLDSTSGVGHAWPAGSGANPGPLAFVSGQGLDAGRFAAEFFAEHNLRVEPSVGTTGGGSTGGGDTTGPMGSESSGTPGSDDTTTTTGSPEPASSSSGPVGTSSGGDASSGEAVADTDDSAGGCRVGGGRGLLPLLVLLGIRRRRSCG